MAKPHQLVTHLAFCLFALFSQTVLALELEPKLIAVQHRNYHLTDELSAYVAYMPLDSFTTYFNANVAYIHYFSEFLAWEVANAGYANSTSTGVQQYIYSTFGGLQAPGYDIANYFVTTSAIYTPMYMKNLIFGSNIGYGDISLVGGFGITKFNDRGNVNTFDFGIILRYFIGPHWALKFDIRNYFYTSADLKNNMAIGVGLGYNFGTPEISDEEAEE